MQFKLYKKSIQSNFIYKNFQQELLDREIEDKKQTLKKLSDLVLTIRNELAGLVTPLDREALCEFIRRNVGKFRSKVQQTHERKLKQLGAKLVLSSCEPSKVTFNFSNYVLSDREHFLLSFGLQISLPILKLSFYKYFLSMEK